MNIQTEKEIKEEIQRLLQKDPVDSTAILSLSRKLSKHDKKYQHFFVDAKTLIHLGRDSIKDHTTALIELVKNSYDADAIKVEVDVCCQKNTIRVADNGFGMTKDDLINGWLQIGFSNKREIKHSKTGRRKTGEKGIGRISADRLGSHLELITKTKQDGIVGLKISWDEFDVEDKDISDINIELLYPDTILIPEKDGIPSETGTEIKISNLRQNWTQQNIENLFNELSTLTPPFNEVKDFKIELTNDVTDSLPQKVSSIYLEVAEIELTAVYDGTGSDILYTIKNKNSKEEEVQTIKWKQVLQKINKADLKEQDSSDDLRCGPVTLKLLFYLREAASVSGAEFKLSDLRKFLDANAGVKIYRDNIAVKPYGFPSSQFGYDWLHLAERKARDPAGISRGDNYTLTPNQLIGAVFISRDTNIALSDSAAREGLVESESFYDLRNMVLGSINILEAHRATTYQQQNKPKEVSKNSSSKEAEQIQSQLISVKEELQSIRLRFDDDNAANSSSTFKDPIDESIAIIEEAARQANKTITDLMNWNRVLSGLATLGISSAVFGHETESSINLITQATDTAKLFLESQSGPEIDIAISELNKAIKHAKKVGAWGAYALTRVQREKRSKKNINIKRAIEGVVKELKSAFESSSIKIEVTGEMLVSKTYQMDIESILINLLTNAYAACNQKPGVRKVAIHVAREERKGQKGYLFSVADTGPGVAKEFQSRIYEPLFSTKTLASGNSKSAGTGLGLTIVRSTVTELGGTVNVDHDTELKGAKFTVWLPLIR